MVVTRLQNYISCIHIIAINRECHRFSSFISFYQYQCDITYICIGISEYKQAVLGKTVNITIDIYLTISFFLFHFIGIKGVLQVPSIHQVPHGINRIVYYQMVHVIHGWDMQYTLFKNVGKM